MIGILLSRHFSILSSIAFSSFLRIPFSETLNVPLEVWAGDKAYMPSEVSANAYEVARAYDKASLKDRNTARLALNLDTVKE